MNFIATFVLYEFFLRQEAKHRYNISSIEQLKKIVIAMGLPRNG